MLKGAPYVELIIMNIYHKTSKVTATYFNYKASASFTQRIVELYLGNNESNFCKVIKANEIRINDSKF